MKRKLEIDLTKEVVRVPYNQHAPPYELILHITQFVDAPECIDIKTYLHWHATCRYLWKEYVKLPTDQVLDITFLKHIHLGTHYTKSIDYYYEYTMNLLNDFYVVLNLNKKMEESLASVLKKRRKGPPTNPQFDPMKEVLVLCKVEDLDTIINFHKGANRYARELLMASCEWVNLRYGWDIRVAYQSKDGTCTFMPMKWPGNHTQMIMVIVACNARYHAT